MTVSKEDIQSRLKEFASHGVLFSDPVQPPAVTEKDGQKIITIYGRSFEPVSCCGALIVHDFETMRKKPVTPICWNHDKIIGKQIGEHRIDPVAGLVMEAELIAFSADPADDTNRVLWMLEKKIPLESSINFSGDFDVEYYGFNEPAVVNGRTYTAGKDEILIVIRNWSLRELSVCDVGRDPHTSTRSVNFRAGIPAKNNNPSNGGKPMPAPVNPKQTEPESEPAAKTDTPLENPPAQPAKPDTESRLSALEKNVDEMKGTLSEMSALLKQLAGEETPDEENPPEDGGGNPDPKQKAAKTAFKQLPLKLGMKNERDLPKNFSTWREFVDQFQLKNGIRDRSTAFSMAKAQFPEIHASFVRNG